ncbi:MAG: CoA transferase [Myxococcales bacterium]|nr:CoA transferase [Myxococcales bacterium]
MKPLEGLRILDLTRIVSGPTCCFYLAAMGAEVIRVEGPEGDITWRVPPFVGPDGAHPGPRGPKDIALSPLRRGRGKRNVVIDLKSDEGRAVFEQLVAKSDALVENFRPGVMKQLGLDYEVLEAINPRLVYCSITGYGHDGPYRDRPSMDLVVQAVSGIMSKTGFPDGPPTKVGVTVGDQVPGIFAALGLVSALRQRDVEGRGQLVDVAMLDALIALMWDEPIDHYEDVGLPERAGNGDPRGSPIGTYPTSDGWIALVTVGEAVWQRMGELIGRPDLLERADDAVRRAELSREIDAAVADWTRTRTSDEVVAALTEIGMAAGHVRPAGHARSDPQVQHRGALERLRHPESDEPSKYWGPALPIRMSRADLRPAPAETLGQSTDAILRDVLDLGDEEIDRLRKLGAVGTR